MRTLRTLGLAVLAALATVAFIGGGSASAVSLCSVNVANCPAPNIYPEGTTLEGELGMAGTTIMMGEAIECGASQIEVESFGSGTPFIMAEVPTLTFGACFTEAEEACVVEGINLPYEALIYQPFGNGNGLLALPAGEGGPPGFEVQCGMVTCLYGMGIKFQVNGGDGEEMIPGLDLLTEELAVQEGSDPVCPENAFWNAEYDIGEPGSLFVTQNP